MEPRRLNGQPDIHLPHAAWGLRGAQRDGNGHLHWRPLHKLDGLECRLEDFGLSEEIVSQLPADRPTPPPPGSKTAARQNS